MSLIDTNCGGSGGGATGASAPVTLSPDPPVAPLRTKIIQ